MKGIASLRHRLTLCRQDDVVTEGGEYKLAREGVKTVWAGIEQKSASAFSRQGAVMKDSKNSRTHIITMRYFTEFNLSSMAWLYEARMKSSPRWFKILNIGQTEAYGSVYFKLDCRLVERSDLAAEPSPESDGSPVVGLPPGVRL